MVAKRIIIFEIEPLIISMPEIKEPSVPRTPKKKSKLRRRKR